jgi:hypothetical protein
VLPKELQVRTVVQSVVGEPVDNANGAKSAVRRYPVPDVLPHLAAGTVAVQHGAKPLGLPQGEDCEVPCRVADTGVAEVDERRRAASVRFEGKVIRLVPLPFCLSWPVPEEAACFTVSAAINGSGDCERSASFIVYVDGHLSVRFPQRNQGIHETLSLNRAETITIVGIAPTLGCTALLEEPFGRKVPLCD